MASTALGATRQSDVPSNDYSDTQSAVTTVVGSWRAGCAERR